MVQWYLDNEAKIVKTALRARGPYVMAVNPSYGLRRPRLAYPPNIERHPGDEEARRDHEDSGRAR
jgi:hypothetical protein